MAAAKTKKATRKKAAERRRERHAELAREDILAAAAAAFAELGYREATVQDIASRAGYTAASLYTYFRGKAELFNALVDSVVASIEAVLASPPDADVDFAARLEMLTASLLRVTENHRHAVVYFMHLQEHGGSRPTSKRTSMPDVLVNVEAWFTENASERDLPNLTAQEASVLFWSVLGGIVRLWAFTDSDQPLSERAPQLVQFFLYGFQGRPRARR